MDMKIAVLGTGQVGGALGRRWAGQGHQVIYGVRDTDSDEVRTVVEASGPNASVGSVVEAAAAAEVVVLGIPWNVTREVLEAIGDFEGRILVDCINPVNAAFNGLEMDNSTSAAELVAQWAPTARVVKAFNTVSAASMEDPLYGGQQASMFYCGDDEASKKVLHELTEELGLEPVDAGPLKNARYLEPLAWLYIHLAVYGGWGDCAFKIIKR
jgi:NADPH-dependent F420 reductase